MAALHLHQRAAAGSSSRVAARQRAAAPAVAPPAAWRGRPVERGIVVPASAACQAQPETAEQTVAGVDVVQALRSTIMALPLVAQPVAGGSGDFSADDFHARFELTGEVLGQGSYGTVRVCTDTTTGQQWAVKILSKRKAGEERGEVIAREVHLWRMLAATSPHIVGLQGAYQDANNIFLVQELLTGGDLQALLDAQGVLDEGEASGALRGVLAALAACHAQDVCYGDVKPANFMLAHSYPSIQHLLDPAKPKGDIQLRAIDFGCAQYCPDGCALLQGLSGTPVYMAPEVIADRRYSIAMDVWAAGVLLFQMLTGRFPFWDTDMAGLGRIHPRQVLRDIQSGAVRTDTAAWQSLPVGAQDLLSRMLERDPSRRITAAQALQHPWLAAQQPEQQQQPQQLAAAAAC